MPEEGAAKPSPEGPAPVAGEIEIDLASYQSDPWDLDEDLIKQQHKK